MEVTVCERCYDCYSAGDERAGSGDAAKMDPWRDDADHVRDVVVELLADGQQPGAVVQGRDDPVSAQLAAEDFDLGHEEANPRVATGGPGLKQEVKNGAEPA